MEMTSGRVLIVTWEGGGNVPPALALATRLAARGHAVRVAAPETMRARVEATGARLAPNRSVAALPTDVDLETVWEQVDAVLNGPGAMDDLRLALREEPADIVVVDSMHGASLAVAEALDLPTVVLAHTLYRRWTQWAPAIMSLQATRATAGLRPVPDDRFVPDVLERCAAVLGLMPEALDVPGGPDPANVHHVGPILTPADAALALAGLERPERLPANALPRALISFGSTVQRQREALDPVLQAFDLLADDEPAVRGLLTLGGVLDPATVGAPSTVDVRGHVPHGPVLPTVDVVIGHGGLSTITGALAAGTPLVLIPQGRDQDDNADRVATTGVGLTLPRDADPASIAAAVRDVLRDPSFRIAARRMGSDIAAAGGGAEAATIVESLVEGPVGHRGRRVTGSQYAVAAG
jgi:UDP:flavonoid glycosyltransferase YjiC (YdhE family)